MMRAAVVILLLLVSVGTQAKNIAVDTCIDLAAKAYKIDPLPLHVIRKVEAGQPGTVSRNDNGTADLGPMQINSIHLKTFSAFGITYADLRDNADCKNVWAAAFLYRKHLNALDGDVVRAIAQYHSRTPRFAYRYLGLVKKVIDREIALRERVNTRATASPRFAAIP
jgi:hypothetical protein